MSETLEVDKSFLNGIINKLEAAHDSEGQFKDTKITEAIVHLKIEATDQTYADLFKEKLEEMD